MTASSRPSPCRKQWPLHVGQLNAVCRQVVFANHHLEGIGVGHFAIHGDTPQQCGHRATANEGGILRQRVHRVGGLLCIRKLRLYRRCGVADGLFTGVSGISKREAGSVIPVAVSHRPTAGIHGDTVSGFNPLQTIGGR